MSGFAILLGGDVTPTARLVAQLKGMRCIAADSGIAHATALGLAPELWVGDFDSAGTELESAFAHVPRAVYPQDKDVTDGELAVDEAIRRGASNLVLVGGFGGQFDHMLAHGTMLLALAERGFQVFGTSGHEEAYPLLKTLSLPDLAHGTRISVVALQNLSDLTISGVRWPLDGKSVAFGSSLTMSNEVAGPVRLTLGAGRALVMAYPQ
jgi:thiamine pyrophosphokinase